MKKFIAILFVSLFGMFNLQALRVIVTFDAPIHTHYIEYHHQCVPPPPMHGPRYYYAPGHPDDHYGRPMPMGGHPAGRPHGFRGR